MFSICAGCVNLTLMFTVLMHAVVFICLFRCVFVCVSGKGGGSWDYLSVSVHNCVLLCCSNGFT